MPNGTNQTNLLHKSRKAAQIARTISWIEEALIDLTKDGRYKDITISEICEKAGVGRQTFYRHYKHKDDIVKNKMRRVFDSIALELRNLPSKDIDYNILHLANIATWKENSDWVKLTSIPCLQTIIFSEIDFLIDMLIERLGIQITIDPYLKAYQLWGMKGALLKWAQSDMSTSPEKIHQVLMSAITP